MYAACACTNKRAVRAPAQSLGLQTLLSLYAEADLQTTSMCRLSLNPTRDRRALYKALLCSAFEMVCSAAQTFHGLMQSSLTTINSQHSHLVYNQLCSRPQLWKKVKLSSPVVCMALRLLSATATKGRQRFKGLHDPCWTRDDCKVLMMPWPLSAHSSSNLHKHTNGVYRLTHAYEHVSFSLYDKHPCITNKKQQHVCPRTLLGVVTHSYKAHASLHS